MARPHEPPPSAEIALIEPGRRNAGADPRTLALREARTSRRVSLLAALVGQRLPESLAHALADDASKLGHEDACRALAAALEQRMRARPINYVNANAILLKGVNGSGKTTVAAKIAAQAFLTGRKVKVLTADANAPRLVELASRLKVQIVALQTPQMISRAVSEAIRRNGLVVIDTSGFNPHRAKERAAFDALGQIGGVDTIGVVSALYDAAEIADEIQALNAQRTIVTGLDLARRAGALAVAATSGPPIAHVARSAFPGDGLEPLTPVALARTLLNLKENQH
jgi:flagellar biosynthesis GTPase FlhF